MEQIQIIPDGLHTVLEDFRESGALKCHEKMDVLDIVSLALQCPVIIDAWIRSGAIILNQGIFMGPEGQTVEDLDNDIQAVLQIYNLLYSRREHMIKILRHEARMYGSSEVFVQSIVFWERVREGLTNHLRRETINMVVNGKCVLVLPQIHDYHYYGLMISPSMMTGIEFRRVVLPGNTVFIRTTEVRMMDGLDNGLYRLHLNSNHGTCGRTVDLKIPVRPLHVHYVIRRPQIREAVCASLKEYGILS